MGKKINELTPLLDAAVQNDNMLVAIADGATGIAGSATIAQLKAALATQKIKYTASGSEGSTLTISAIAGKSILMIAREGTIIYEVTSGPGSSEFSFNLTDITLGAAVSGAGERFLILYKTI